jgi:hypothetical protein
MRVDFLGQRHGTAPSGSPALVIAFLLFVLGKPIERALCRRTLDKPIAEKQEVKLRKE